MGILRLLLAVSVLLAHANPRLHLVGGVSAVEIFFMISGFYMGLVLTERYVGPGSYRTFIGNRALRLFPAYFAVVILSVLWWGALAVKSHVLGPLALFHSGQRLSVIIVSTVIQITLLGQDLFYYLRLTPAGSLAWTHEYKAYKNPLFNFALVPQAWSLSLELSFYLLAPLLVRLHTRTLVLLAMASLALRVYFYDVLGWQNDPWFYRFFPNELLFFVAGVLAYRIYSAFKSRRPGYGQLTLVAAICFGVIVIFPWLPGKTEIGGFAPRTWALYGLTWATLPALFLWSNPPRGEKSWLRTSDRWIGELSYPVYITHLLVLAVLAGVGHHFPPSSILPLAFIATFALSLALLRFVMLPIEKIRDRRVRQIDSPLMETAINVVNP